MAYTRAAMVETGNEGVAQAFHGGDQFDLVGVQ